MAIKNKVRWVLYESYFMFGLCLLFSTMSALDHGSRVLHRAMSFTCLAIGASLVGVHAALDSIKQQTNQLEQNKTDDEEK